MAKAREGDIAPDFTLPWTGEGEFSLAERRGRWVILAFYPGDFTPTCTKQFCNYRDGREQIDDLDAEVVGISPQDVDSHEKWIKAKEFPFPLLADTDKTVINAYGVKGFGPIPVKRSTFVIDAEGILRHKRVASIGMTWDKPGQLAEIVRQV
jgi:peroxiredoxin Q/BCP